MQTRLFPTRNGVGAKLITLHLNILLIILKHDTYTINNTGTVSSSDVNPNTLNLDPDPEFWFNTVWSSGFERRKKIVLEENYFS